MSLYSNVVHPLPPNGKVSLPINGVMIIFLKMLFNKYFVPVPNGGASDGSHKRIHLN